MFYALGFFFVSHSVQMRIKNKDKGFSIQCLHKRTWYMYKIRRHFAQFSKENLTISIPCWTWGQVCAHFKLWFCVKLQLETYTKENNNTGSLRWNQFLVWSEDWRNGGSNEPTHEIMALFILRKPILQTPMHSHPAGLDVLTFGRTLRLPSYFMFANIEGSGETARMRRLTWAFAGHICDKYHNLMSWLKWANFGL